MRTANNSAIQYAPEDPPADPKELQRYLRGEIAKLSAVVAALAAGHLDKSHVAPDKPRDGDLRYASGAPDWNPGSGLGLYQYQGSAWVMFGALITAAGVYTPTLTNTANVAASTAYECQYQRVGSVVTVSGRVDVDPNLTATDTQLGISLPIASDFAATRQCAGAAAAPGIAGQSAAILGDVTNNRAVMQWRASDVSNQAMYFTFTYRII